MKKTIRITAMLLAMVMLFAPSVGALNMTYFLQHYPDAHFDLTNEPNRVATVEEFVAVVTAYSYYTDGVSTTPVADKTGSQPSAWCAKYVQAEVNKGVLTPQTYAYSAPATVAFAAEYLSRCKGLYAWDYENAYSFSDTAGLTAEQKMFLNVAADHKLIAYTRGMRATAQITRAQLTKYLIPTTVTTPTTPAEASDGGMKELHAYFTTDSTEDFDAPAEQFKRLKQYGSDLTMVTFLAAFISNHTPNSGYQYIHENMSLDDVPDAAAYCQSKNILTFLGVSNFGTSGFDSTTIENLLSSTSKMDAAISEIVTLAKRYDMDGVNMGFEHVSPTMRSAYSTFLTKLATRLHAEDKLLMTTVGAYFRTDLEQASVFDYQKIGSVSDYVHVILYDDHSDTAYNAWTTDPGEMSNMVTIDRTMRYATQLIPSGKILLGMASFGIDYNTTNHTAQDTPRSTLVARASGTTIQQTVDARGGKFTYTASDGTHIVYLETDTGICSRLLRTYRYGLCGASFFYLGSDQPAIAQYATSLSAYKPEVLSAIQADLVPKNYRKLYKNAITRPEFCDLVVACIESASRESIDAFLSDKGVAVQQGQFSDTSSSNVLAAAALGIVNGREDGTFGTGTVTRQEAAAMLSRLAQCLGYTASGTAVNFTDTTTLATWAQQGISAVSAITDPTNNKRVMNGTSSTAFSPLSYYTREQAYMTMVRLYHAVKGA